MHRHVHSDSALRLDTPALGCFAREMQPQALARSARSESLPRNIHCLCGPCLLPDGGHRTRRRTRRVSSLSAHRCGSGGHPCRGLGAVRAHTREALVACAHGHACSREIVLEVAYLGSLRPCALLQLRDGSAERFRLALKVFADGDLLFEDVPQNLAWSQAMKVLHGSRHLVQHGLPLLRQRSKQAPGAVELCQKISPLRPQPLHARPGRRRQLSAAVGHRKARWGLAVKSSAGLCQL
mmetsp:Transcript_17284/g.56526  ORF Transcript_17284/g.56526 Transcript_17284/m.56526 type:complete len:238 (+) Transcript_17284:197-910(+)|eukprot:scaffold29011_cov111-Isochrysis_galbana.AAC.1